MEVGNTAHDRHNDSRYSLICSFTIYQTGGLMKTISRLRLCSARLLLVFFAVFASSHATERILLNAITRFPYQDTTRSNSEAFPLALSGQTVMFVWADSTAIRYSKSTDEGVTWNAPVNILTPVLSANMLTGIRTIAGRLIIAFYDSATVRYTSSDDDGLNWSPTIWPCCDRFKGSPTVPNI